jgi:hypothetical protein
MNVPTGRRGLADCRHYRADMRLGVLDAGSNTVHLLVVTHIVGATPPP